MNVACPAQVARHGSERHRSRRTVDQIRKYLVFLCLRNAARDASAHPIMIPINKDAFFSADVGESD